MDRSPTQEIPFTDGQGQPQNDGMDPIERGLMERYQTDPEFRRQATQQFHAMQAGVPAGQRYQQPEPQQTQPQESELDRTERLYSQKQERVRQLENIHRTEGRNPTQDEIAELNRLDAELPRLELELTRLTRVALNQDRQQLQQQATYGQLEQEKRKHFDRQVHPRIQNANLPVAEKERFYGIALDLFQRNPLYARVSTFEECDAVIESVMSQLIHQHRFPVQRPQTARQGEELNDLDGQKPDDGGDRWSHLPPDVAGPLREKFGSRPKVTN